jgi:KTSC domain
VKRERVESSSLASVGYDAETSVLEIAFREGGVYQYFQVPERVHRDLIAADSLGSYFTQHIRPVYSFRRVD